MPLDEWMYNELRVEVNGLIKGTNQVEESKRK